MRYRLRTLLILLAVLPPLLWFGWGNYQAWKAEQARLKALREATQQNWFVTIGPNAGKPLPPGFVMPPPY